MTSPKNGNISAAAGLWCPWQCNESRILELGLSAVCSIAPNLIRAVADATNADLSELWGGPDNDYYALYSHLDVTFKRAVQQHKVLAFYPRLWKQTATAAPDSPTAELAAHGPFPRALCFNTGLSDDKNQRVFLLITRSETVPIPSIEGPDGSLTHALIAESWSPHEWSLRWGLSELDLSDRRSAAWGTIRNSIAASLPASAFQAANLAAAANCSNSSTPSNSQGGSSVDSLSQSGSTLSMPRSTANGEVSTPIVSASDLSVDTTAGSLDALTILPASSLFAAGQGFTVLSPASGRLTSGTPLSGSTPANVTAATLRYIVDPIPRAMQPEPGTFHTSPRDLTYDTSLPIVPKYSEMLGRDGTDEFTLRGALPTTLKHVTRQQIGHRMRAGVEWAIARASGDYRGVVARYDPVEKKCSLLLPLPLDLNTDPNAQGITGTSCPAIHAAAVMYLSADGKNYEVRRVLSLSNAHIHARYLGKVNVAWLKGLARGGPIYSVTINASGQRLLSPAVQHGPLLPCITGSLASALPAANGETPESSPDGTPHNSSYVDLYAGQNEATRKTPSVASHEDSASFDAPAARRPAAVQAPAQQPMREPISQYADPPRYNMPRQPAVEPVPLAAYSATHSQYEPPRYAASYPRPAAPVARPVYPPPMYVPSRGYEDSPQYYGGDPQQLQRYPQQQQQQQSAAALMKQRMPAYPEPDPRIMAGESPYPRQQQRQAPPAMAPNAAAGSPFLFGTVTEWWEERDPRYKDREPGTGIVALNVDSPEARALSAATGTPIPLTVLVRRSSVSLPPAVQLGGMPPPRPLLTVNQRVICRLATNNMTRQVEAIDVEPLNVSPYPGSTHGQASHPQQPQQQPQQQQQRRPTQQQQQQSPLFASDTILPPSGGGLLNFGMTSSGQPGPFGNQYLGADIPEDSWSQHINDIIHSASTPHLEQ